MVVGGTIIIPSVAIGIPWHVGYALHSSPRNHEHRGQALLQPASRTGPSVKTVRIINRFMGAISELAAIAWTSRQPSKHGFQRDPVPPNAIGSTFIRWTAAMPAFVWARQLYNTAHDVQTQPLLFRLTASLFFTVLRGISATVSKRRRWSIDHSAVARNGGTTTMAQPTNRYGTSGAISNRRTVAIGIHCLLWATRRRQGRKIPCPRRIGRLTPSGSSALGICRLPSRTAIP